MTSVTDRRLFFRQDFSGGLTEPQISNIAFTAIHALAQLADHLRRWAKANKNLAGEVEAAIEGSSALPIIIDLSNRDKHGPPRDGGRTGSAPSLHNLRRIMRITTAPEPGAAMSVQFTTSGAVARGPGSALVIITADVVAADGSPLGDLTDLLADGLTNWQALLSQWGLSGQKAV